MWNLPWETSGIQRGKFHKKHKKCIQIAHKNKKRAYQKSLGSRFPRLNSTVGGIYFKKNVSTILMFE
jgi:hypothetical protein